MSMQHLRHQPTSNDATNRKTAAPCVSTSLTMATLSPAGSWPIAVQKRVSTFTSLPWTCSEALQLVRYTVNQSFGDHTDFFPPGAAGNVGGGSASGQRLFTAFLYLNDDFEGGETVFPLINITVAPKKGTMLFWRNTLKAPHPALPRGNAAPDVPFASPAVDGRTEHRGNPVLKGVKYAANLWILERPFELYRTTLL